MIKRLLSAIPRDRTLLLLLAPVVAVAAIGGAALLDKGPTPATQRAGTTTTEVGTKEAPGAEVAGETAEAPGGGADAGGGSSDAVALGAPDLSAEANSDYRGGVPPGADVLDATLAAPPTTAPPTTGAPSTTLPGQTTTSQPGGATTTTVPSPTTTVPGPPPVVSESPVAALLPLSALVAVGLAAGLLFRRRRRQGPAAE